MGANATPRPLIGRDQVQEMNEKHGWFQFADAQSDVSNAFANEAIERYERIRAAAPALLEALKRAEEFIENMQAELHNRRVADWYPEGANNAALQMSENMRLLGNACADFQFSDAIAKATGAQP